MKRFLSLGVLLALASLPAVAQPAASADVSAAATAGLPAIGPSHPLRLPSVVQKELPNGLKLVILEDHTQPAVWLRLAVSAGSLRDPLNRVGLAAITADMLDKGTTSRSETQIADTVDGLGASLGASASDDYLTVSANGLSAYTDTLFDLMADITLHATFPQDELDRVRTRTLSSITASLAEPATLATAAINRMVYGAHPYGNFSNGTPKTLNAITRQDLQSFHDRLFAPNLATLFIVGDITPAQAEQKAQAMLGNWERKPLPPVIKPPMNAAASAATPQIILIDRPGAAQTEIRIGILTQGYGDPNRITARVASAVLGEGQFEGRLTKEIRVKRGLTYGAASSFARNREGGMFEISTFTKNKSTGEVVRIALEEAQKLRTQPTPAAELQERKQYIDGYFNVSVATAPGVLRRLIPAVLYGAGPGDLTEYTSKVDAVTPEQIESVMNALPLGAPYVVLVGDASEIEAQVKPLGKVTKISSDAVDLLSPTLQAGAGNGDTTTKPAVASDPEAKARLDATIKAHGGDAFLNVKQVVLKGDGEISPPDQPIKLKVATAVLTFASPNRSRFELNTTLGDVIFGSDANGKAWLSLLGGIQDSPMTLGDPLELIRRASQKNYGLALLPDSKPAAAGDKAFQGVSVTDEQGRVVKIYLDPDSHLLRRIELPGQQGTMTLLLDNYKQSDNIMLPGALRVVQGDKTFVNLKFNAYEVNKPVDDKIFQRPKE